MLVDRKDFVTWIFAAAIFQILWFILAITQVPSHRRLSQPLTKRPITPVPALGGHLLTRQVLLPGFDHLHHPLITTSKSATPVDD